MDLLREKQRARGHHRPHKGGSKSEANPETNNIDRRVAVDSGIGISGDRNLIDKSSRWNISDSRDMSNRSTTNYSDNSQRADAAVLSATAAMQGDAVKAMANAGSDMVRRSQEALVDLNATSTAANRDMWDTTVTQGARLVDRLIDQVGDSMSTAKDFAVTGQHLAETAIKSYQPADSKVGDGLKWAMIAAAAVAAAAILGAKK